MPRIAFATLLFLCSTLLAAQTYTFDDDTQGWDTNADGSSPVWEPTGGNPGGWISAFDISTGGTWHWIAPPEVLGNACGSYGLKLSFDLKTSQQVTNNSKADVILVSNGMELVYNLEYDPYTFWTPYEVVLKEDAGWRIATVFGGVPTKEQFMEVLQNLEALRIRGEYLQQAEDYGGLDNVKLGTTTFEFDLDKNDSTTPLNSKNFVNDTSCTDLARICDEDLRSSPSTRSWCSSLRRPMVRQSGWNILLRVRHLLVVRWSWAAVRAVLRCAVRARRWPRPTAMFCNRSFTEIVRPGLRPLCVRFGWRYSRLAARWGKVMLMCRCSRPPMRVKMAQRIFAPTIPRATSLIL
jgi:hypothetical protein